jgi:hypothetical protein
MNLLNKILSILGLVKKVEEVKKAATSEEKIVGAVEIIQGVDQLRKDLKK